MVEEKKDSYMDECRTDTGQQRDTNNKGNKGKNVYTPEFEEFYMTYPNPQNKQQSFKNWKTCLKTHSADELLRAVENYKKSVGDRDRQYIKTSSNFLGRDKFYTDYLPQNYKEDIPKTRGW